MKSVPRAQPTPINHSPSTRTQQTLIDHLQELRARLFWTLLFLIAAAGLGYVLQAQITAVLMQPLGGQRLVYLTPIGGFNFLFKVSLYFGIALILPVIMYHLYRFLEPIMDQRLKRSVSFYSVASFGLAVGGACFAYFGSLPAALHFLTGFSIQNVSAMLTVDSYLSFVITYVLGFAALFQIPLILMIINTITPLPPKKLFGFQRFVVLGAFIVAAIISPTPDITNQTILAVPIILMYELGVFLVWVQSKKLPQQSTHTVPRPAVTPQPIIRRTQAPQPAVAHKEKALRQHHPVAQRPVMDISMHRRTAPQQARRPVQPRSAQYGIARPMQRPLNRSASIDGFAPRSQHMPQAG